MDPFPEPIGYTAFVCGPEEVFTDEWQHCTQHMVFGENAFHFAFIWDEELSIMKFPGVLSTFGNAKMCYPVQACHIYALQTADCIHAYIHQVNSPGTKLSRTFPGPWNRCVIIIMESVRA
jgi:hypothetical protein